MTGFCDVILAVDDVDSEDGAELDLCKEYVNDIHADLRQLEEERSVRAKWVEKSLEL